MTANTREHFFVQWLPARFEEFAKASPQLGSTQCSILVQIDDDAYWIEVTDGKLRTTTGNTDATSTFRLRTDAHTFEKLIAPAAESATQSDPMLRLMQLDAEALALVSNVPACLKLSVKAPDTTYSMVLGPGTQAPDNVGCSVECSLEDMLSIQRGEAQPIELLMNGKLALDGDLQIAMALGGLLI